MAAQSIPTIPSKNRPLRASVRPYRVQVHEGAVVTIIDNGILAKRLTSPSVMNCNARLTSSVKLIIYSPLRNFRDSG
jgi:hypothetical protein